MDLEVGAKQIERLTEQIGAERCAERDAEVERYLSLPLTERKDKPAGVTAPAVAVVGADGGRLQILERSNQSVSVADDTPATDPADGEASLPPDEKQRGTHWREDKIGLLMTMTSKEEACDPCPQVPTVFLDPTRILKLTRELKTKRSAAEEAAKQEAVKDTDHPEATEEVLRTAGKPVAWQPPEMKEKQLVATRRRWAAFGPMLAALAWKLGYYQAQRKAFLGDGSDNNWKLHRQHFSSFTPILDIIHALSYVFAAAMAARPFAQGWPIYACWVTWLWAGEVEKIIAALAQRQAELGAPQADDGETHPRQVVATALGYLQNHKDKMRYADYRRLGLPITSSYVESAVKQFNQRVKGTEKFWTEEGAEALLQMRADHLSDDTPMAAFWQRRQENETGLRNYTMAA
jgi:Zn-finger nucleic acid-binding protein